MFAILLNQLHMAPGVHRGHFKGFLSLSLKSSTHSGVSFSYDLCVRVYVCDLHVLHALHQPESTDVYLCHWNDGVF